MKRTLLKIGNIASYITIGAGSIATITAFLYGILPAETTQPVIDTLNMNAQAIAPVGIASVFTTGTIATAKIMLSALREKLHQSNLSLKLWETDVNKKINTRFELQEQLNDTVVLKQNELLEYLKVIDTQQKSIIEFNAITAQRNLSMSDELVPPQIKEQYKQALDQAKSLDVRITPITKIVEETIIKEVQKEVTNKVSW